MKRLLVIILGVAMALAFAAFHENYTGYDTVSVCLEVDNNFNYTTHTTTIVVDLSVT